MLIYVPLQLCRTKDSYKSVLSCRTGLRYIQQWLVTTVMVIYHCCAMGSSCQLYHLLQLVEPIAEQDHCVFSLTKFYIVSSYHETSQFLSTYLCLYTYNRVIPSLNQRNFFCIVVVVNPETHNWTVAVEFSTISKNSKSALLSLREHHGRKGRKKVLINNVFST